MRRRQVAGVVDAETLEFDPDGGSHRPGVGPRIAVLASILLVLGGAVGLLVAFAGDGSPGSVADDADRSETDEPDPDAPASTIETDVDLIDDQTSTVPGPSDQYEFSEPDTSAKDADATDEPVDIVEPVDLAEPVDVVGGETDWISLPIRADPGSNLVDGQTVTVYGTGFTPLAEVVVAQCWGDEAPGGPGWNDALLREAAQADCDVALAVGSTAGADGNVEMAFTVRRFVNVVEGTKDCAAPVAARCWLGMANTENYENAGLSQIFFKAPPSIDVASTTGLVDGQILTVTGSGFVPGETVVLRQCVADFYPFGGAGCQGKNRPSAVVEADGAGSFVTTVDARRLLRVGSEDVDCPSGSFDCMLVVVAEQIANSVQLAYDGSDGVPDPFSYTVSPEHDLGDQDVVRLEIHGVPERTGITVSQCAPTGYGKADDEICVLLEEAPVVEGRIGVDLVVHLVIGDGADALNCGETLNCYPRVDGIWVGGQHISIHFGPVEQ